MANIFQEAKITGLAAYFPTMLEKTADYREVYEANRRRVYALAFWMTDHEMAAEELMSEVFHRAFRMTAEPTRETVDRALILELREVMPLGGLSLSCAMSTAVESIRRNTMRVHLERAVVQLPATERLIFLLHDVEGYDHARVARVLGITEEESKIGLHQSRLRIRELVASMLA